jgi:hypothetical protein
VVAGTFTFLFSAAGRLAGLAFTGFCGFWVLFFAIGCFFVAFGAAFTVEVVLSWALLGIVERPFFAFPS